MVDKTQKLLRTMPLEDKKRIEKVLDLIDRGVTTNLDIKKLQCFENQYRVRVGKYRIILLKLPQGFKFFRIDRRHEQTYKP